MNNFKAGFTIIELMIVIAIVGILAAFAGTLFQSHEPLSALLSGERCISGYKFVQDSNGTLVQIMGATGPVACQ